MLGLNLLLAASHIVAGLGRLLRVTVLFILNLFICYILSYLSVGTFYYFVFSPFLFFFFFIFYKWGNHIRVYQCEYISNLCCPSE